MNLLLSDVSRAYARYVARTYGTTVNVSRETPVVLAVREALATMGVPDVGAFLERFSFTLGDQVFLSFAPGDATTKHGVIREVSTLAHEHQHVVQSRRLGVEFFVRYLKDAAFRAEVEVEAYRVNLEVASWAFGPNAIAGADQDFARLLADSYMLDQTSAKFAKRHLELSYLDVIRNNTRTELGLRTVQWLAENAPQHLWR